MRRGHNVTIKGPRPGIREAFWRYVAAKKRTEKISQLTRITCQNLVWINKLKKKKCVEKMKFKKPFKSTGKRDSKEKKPSNRYFRVSSKAYFLTYKGTSDTGQKITKQSLADFLLNPSLRHQRVFPQKYVICQQMYDSGQPHFHAILIYSRRKQILYQDAFDFLNIHPNIQSLRNKKAALEYVYKEDPCPLTNMDLVRQQRATRASHTGSLYQLLEQQMVKDPFNFDIDQYCAEHDLFKQVYKADFSKALVLLKRAQPAYARKLLQQKPGIALITLELIESRLNPAELAQYYSHPAYARIVAHINDIHRYPNRDPATMAPSKTPHLLIVGDSSIGKSALVDHRPSAVCPHPGLMHYYPCYHMSIGQKFFPPYRSFDYPLVRWNEFTIASDLFPKSGYNRLLDYLEGAPSALPQKGRPPVERQDNPKHILTSNRTLQQHICKTFGSEESRALARRNLGTRIDCVVIPRGESIHFLRKLFVPRVR